MLNTLSPYRNRCARTYLRLRSCKRNKVYLLTVFYPGKHKQDHRKVCFYSTLPLPKIKSSVDERIVLWNINTHYCRMKCVPREANFLWVHNRIQPRRGSMQHPHVIMILRLEDLLMRTAMYQQDKEFLDTICLPIVIIIRLII